MIKKINIAVREYVAGECVYRAVWLLRLAAKMTAKTFYQKRVRGALRGIWDAGLQSQDIDGGPASSIPTKLKEA